MRAVVSCCVYLVYAGILTAGVLALRGGPGARLLRASQRVRWVLAGLLGLSMFVLAEPLRDVAQDFIDAYYAGGVAILSGATSAEQLYSRGVNGFVNAPLVGVLFVPFALLPPKLAALLYLLLGVIACVAAYRAMVTLAGLDEPLSLVLAFWMLVNGPLMNSVKEGNTSHFALWAIAAAMLSLRKGRDARAGMLLGALSIFKLPLALFFVWAALRGRFRLVLGGGAVLVGFALVSIAWFGWAVHVTWYEQFVASSGGKLVAGFNNQSFPALFARFRYPVGQLCDWNPVAIDPTSRVLSALARVALLASAVLAIFWQRLQTRRSRPATSSELELEMAMVALLTCLLSPLAWSHYYAWTLLAVALLMRAPPSALGSGFRGTRAVATVLVSLPVVWPWCSLSWPLTWPYRLVISHYLFGAVLLFGLLAVRRAEGAAKPSPTV